MPTWTQLATKIGEAKSIVGAVIVIGGVIISLIAVGKVPIQLAEHNRAMTSQLDRVTAQSEQTNRKLDVLICLQAKLDTPIRCVARERQ